MFYCLPSLLKAEKRSRKGRRESKKSIKRLRLSALKVLEQYVVLGRFDFVNIVEGPNNDAIMRVSIELGSRGTVQIMSLLNLLMIS